MQSANNIRLQWNDVIYLPRDTTRSIPCSHFGKIVNFTDEEFIGPIRRCHLRYRSTGCTSRRKIGRIFIWVSLYFSLVKLSAFLWVCISPRFVFRQYSNLSLLIVCRAPSFTLYRIVCGLPERGYFLFVFLIPGSIGSVNFLSIRSTPSAIIFIAAQPRSLNLLRMPLAICRLSLCWRHRLVPSVSRGRGAGISIALRIQRSAQSMRQTFPG